jgi:hypothetical protein
LIVSQPRLLLRGRAGVRGDVLQQRLANDFSILLLLDLEGLEGSCCASHGQRSLLLLLLLLAKGSRCASHGVKAVEGTDCCCRLRLRLRLWLWLWLGLRLRMRLRLGLGL